MESTPNTNKGGDASKQHTSNPAHDQRKKCPLQLVHEYEVASAKLQAKEEVVSDKLRAWDAAHPKSKNPDPSFQPEQRIIQTLYRNAMLRQVQDVMEEQLKLFETFQADMRDHTKFTSAEEQKQQEQIAALREQVNKSGQHSDSAGNGAQSKDSK